MAILQMTINAMNNSRDYCFSYHTPKENWIVDWGDGIIEVNTYCHTYKESGLYQITVKGDFALEALEPDVTIVSLDREEGCGITSLDCCFAYCPYLISVPHDWDVSDVVDMEGMFEDCVSFNQDLSHWNLSGVETEDMFKNCPIEDKHKPKGIE